MANPRRPAAGPAPDPGPPAAAVREVDPRTLRPDPDQPRRDIDQKAVDDLAASAAQHGIVQPIEVDETGMITMGELRWRAAVKAGLGTVPVIDAPPGLTPADRYVRQVIENLHHNELSDRDASNALLCLRELRLQGKLLAPTVPGTKRPKNPKGGRPPGFEPGSTRELAAVVGRSYKWVQRHISDTYVEPEDVPEALRPALDGGQLHRDAVAAIRRRCPEPYREALIQRVAGQAARGYVATRGVQAVVDGLREVAQTGGDGHAAERLIDLVRANERGSFIEAQVRAVTPRTPEERAAAAAKDQRAFDSALDAAGRLLNATDKTAKFGRRSKTRDRAERLQAAAERWLAAVDRLPPVEPAPAPLWQSPEPADFLVTADLGEAERLALEVIILRAYVFRKTTQTTRIADALSSALAFYRGTIDVLRRLESLGAAHEQERDGPAHLVEDEDRLWRPARRRFIFAEGAFVSLARCDRGRLGA